MWVNLSERKILMPSLPATHDEQFVPEWPSYTLLKNIGGHLHHAVTSGLRGQGGVEDVSYLMANNEWVCLIGSIGLGDLQLYVYQLSHVSLSRGVTMENLTTELPQGLTILN
jgi:hypothetical protein